MTLFTLLLEVVLIVL